MEGKYRVKGTNNPHLMTALGIESTRCEELCGLVSGIVEREPGLALAEVIAEASEHVISPEELAFVSCVAGEVFTVKSLHKQVILASLFRAVGVN